MCWSTSRPKEPFGGQWRLRRSNLYNLHRSFHSISGNMQLTQRQAMGLLTCFCVINFMIMTTLKLNMDKISHVQRRHSGLKMSLVNSRLERDLIESTGTLASMVTSSWEDTPGACREKFDWGVVKRSSLSSSLTILPPADPCCLARPGSVFLLILVTSSPRQFKVRQAIRGTWGGVRNAGGDDRRVLVRFLLGAARGASNWERTQSFILAENTEHGDIIQGDFEDVYRNLTLKTITGMGWAGHYCPAASYVMKTDSDVYVNVDDLVRYLSNSSQVHSHRLAVGDVAIGAKPIRSQVIKWYTTESEYPHLTYPPFMKGPGYVVSAEVVQMLLQSFSKTPVFVWEDVYIGLCLKTMGIVPTADKRFEIPDDVVTSGCDVAQRFLFHGMKYYQMKWMWRIHQAAKNSARCSLRKHKQ